MTYIWVAINFVILHVLATSCQVYPSEYAYRDDSVTRTESASANCRRYPAISGLPAGTYSIDYIHCDGTKLKLADSNLGSEQFSSNSYYQWNSGSAQQLLFILPTSVSLTTITLHYYSDNVRGRPRLRFYALPDDFDIWDALTSGNPWVSIPSVPPDGEPTGRRNIRIYVIFNTKKVLMYKFSSTFSFALSEVEFFTYCSKWALAVVNLEHGLVYTIILAPLTTNEAITYAILIPLRWPRRTLSSHNQPPLPQVWSLLFHGHWISLIQVRWIINRFLA
jgi:hypothetical protein